MTQPVLLSLLVALVRSFPLYLTDKPVKHDTYVNNIYCLNYSTSPKHVVKWRWLGNGQCLFRCLYEKHADAVWQNEEFLIFKKWVLIHSHWNLMFLSCSNLITCVSGLLLRSVTFTVPKSYVLFLCLSYLSLCVVVLKFCSHFLSFPCTRRRLHLSDLITPKICRVHISYKGFETSNGFALFVPCFIMKRNSHVAPTKAVFCNLIKFNKVVTVSVIARLLWRSLLLCVLKIFGVSSLKIAIYGRNM
jgi:hypothetical protein